MQALPQNITPKHVERGIQMRAIVQYDITRRGMKFEEAAEALAEYLGVDVFSVKLGIAIANEYAIGGDSY